MRRPDKKQKKSKYVLVPSCQKRSLVGNFNAKQPNKKTLFLRRSHQKTLPEKTFNQKLIDTLKTLVQSDQSVRKTNNQKTIWETDSINGIKLAEIIKNMNFPSEDEIGFGGILPNEDLYMVLIIHQNQLRRSYNFTNLLHDAVKQGKLLPNTAMLLMLNQSDSDIFSLHSSFNDKLFDKFEKTNTNENRKQWGVANFNEYQKKVEFSLRDSTFEFNIKRVALIVN
jgi:hypothetical protein